MQTLTVQIGKYRNLEIPKVQNGNTNRQRTLGKYISRNTQRKIQVETIKSENTNHLKNLKIRAGTYKSGNIFRSIHIRKQHG